MENLVKNQSNKLIFSGILLFLIGLVIGLLVPIFANPRMGVSSHIEGVMNGMFLTMLGLIWHKLDLSDRWLKITFGLAIKARAMATRCFCPPLNSDGK